MSTGQKETSTKIIKWLIGPDAQTKLGTSMTKEFVGTQIDQQGDKQATMVGVQGGRVAWPVEPFFHQNMSFMGADCFIAEWDPESQTAHMIDKPDNGRGWGHHFRHRPLKLGINLFMAGSIPKKKQIGLVVRTAEYSEDGMNYNVFFPQDQRQPPITPGPPPPSPPPFKIVAHHLHVNLPPNVDSSLIYDDDGRFGPMDDQWRVRMYNPKNRQPYDATGNTSAPTPIPPMSSGEDWCLLLNMAPSGVGEGRGNGMWYFGGQVSRFSVHDGGPFTPGTTKHQQTATPEDVWTVGAIHTDALFNQGSPSFDGPLDFEIAFEPQVIDEGEIRRRVHLQFDPDTDPTAPIYSKPHVGKRRGKWRWHVRDDKVKMPKCKPEKDKITSPHFDAVGGSENFFDGPIEVGGITGTGYPGAHKRAK